MHHPQNKNSWCHIICSVIYHAYIVLQLGTSSAVDQSAVAKVRQSTPERHSAASNFSRAVFRHVRCCRGELQSSVRWGEEQGHKYVRDNEENES